MASAALRRLILQLTQQRTAGWDVDTLQSLEAFLDDPGGVDQVYKTIMDRASVRPFSPVAVGKCLSLTKRFLLTHPPSAKLLVQLDDFCLGLTTILGSSDFDEFQSIESSVNFVRNALARLQGRNAPRSYSREPPSVFDTAHRPTGPSSSVAAQSAQVATDIEVGQDAVQPNMLSSRWGPSREAQQWLTAHDEAVLNNSGLAADIQDLTLELRKRSGKQEGAKSHARHPATRPRLLFSFRPYCEQDTLPLSDEDIQSVLDIFCNDDSRGQSQHPAAGAGSSSYATWANDDHVCGAVVIKLVVDMWLQAGPTASLPLALLLLRRAYSNPRPQIRCRAFDLLANLLVHAEMLYQLTPSSQDAEQYPTPKRGRQPRASFGGSAAAANAPQRLAGFRHWLRLLLFQLLDVAVEEQETGEVVWQAALGCLLHMCCRDGTVVRPFVRGLPLAALRQLLHCCDIYHWSKEVKQHLLHIVMCLLYPEPPGPETQLAAYPDDLVHGTSGGQPSAAEAASISTLPGHPPPLDANALSDFGGLAEVVAQFKAADSSEARSNMFCVLFDHSIPQIQQVDASAASDVKTLGRLVAELHLADALQPLFLAAQPELMRHVADEICTYLDTLKSSRQRGGAGSSASSTGSYSGRQSAAGGDPMWDNLNALVRSVLSVLQNIMLEHAGTSIPAELQPALQETLAAVANASSSAQSHSAAAPQGMEASWAQLADLLTGADAGAAAQGQAWLLQLLIASSQRQQQDSPGVSQHNLVGLLPQPPESQTDKRGMGSQPQVAHLLRFVLCNGRVETDTASRFADVVSRFLLFAKLQMALASSQALLDAGKNVTSAAGSPEGVISLPLAGTLTLTPRAGAAVVPQGGLVLTPRLLLNTPTGSSEYKPPEGGEPWQTQQPLRLLTATMTLAMEWLTLAVPTCRHRALVQLATLLLQLVAQGGSCRLALLLPPVQSTLDGFATVSQETVQSLDVLLLLRLLRELTAASVALPGSTGTSAAAFGGASMQLQDVRVGILLLLLGRIRGDTAEYHHIGGEKLCLDLLYDKDARIRLYASMFLQRQLAEHRPLEYSRSLQALVKQAQQADNEKLLTSSFLQLDAMLQLDLISFIQ